MLINPIYLAGPDPGEVTESSNHKDDDRELHEDGGAGDFPFSFLSAEENNVNFIGCSNGDYSGGSCPSSFQVMEEIKVNHGMFVATRQVAETLFHQVVPSQILKVQNLHQMPMSMLDSQSSVGKEGKLGSSLLARQRRISPSFLKSMMRTWIKSGSSIFHVLGILWIMCIIHLGDGMADKTMMMDARFHAMENVPASPGMSKRRRKGVITKWDNHHEQQRHQTISPPAKPEGTLSVCLRKIGFLLTIALALSAVWINQVLLAS